MILPIEAQSKYFSRRVETIDGQRSPEAVFTGQTLGLEFPIAIAATSAEKNGMTHYELTVTTTGESIVNITNFEVQSFPQILVDQIRLAVAKAVEIAHTSKIELAKAHKKLRIEVYSHQVRLINPLKENRFPYAGSVN